MKDGDLIIDAFLADLVEAVKLVEVIFSWQLTGTATMYAGPLVFSLHFKCLTGAEIDYKWSTEDNTDFTIRANTYNAPHPGNAKRQVAHPYHL